MPYADWLRRIQNDLFDVGADISVPHGGDRERLRLAPEQTEWLEHACDEVNATLEPLKSFVLPGGTPAAAHLHVCRTVCRRAERRTIDCGDDVNRECVRYLNRLSDLLFILSRGANGGDEPLWEPGQVPLSMYRAEHRALRELHATGRQLASHWWRLGDRLGGAPAARACRTAPRSPAAMVTELAKQTAERGLHGFPAAQGVGSRLAGLRNTAGDLVLERNQALRLAVLDAEHVATLLEYLAALADKRGDEPLAAFHHHWRDEIAAARDAVRHAAIALADDPERRDPRPPRARSSAAPATAPPPRSARSARRSTARRSARPRARSPSNQ